MENSGSDNSAISPTLSQFVDNLVDGNYSELSDLDHLLDDFESETPKSPPTNQPVSNTQESEREYWEPQNQQQDVSDYQQSSTSEGVSNLSTESLEKSDWEDPFADFPIYGEDLVPPEDIECQFSLERRSDVVSDKNRIVQSECQPVEVSNVKQNKKSQKYIHVTRDNRDDFKKIPVDTEFLAYTMKEPEDRPYDQVHPSIQGHIRKVDVPVGEDPLFRCAYPGCERQGDPFTNRENCKNHVEKDHFGIQFECPKPDCNACRHGYYKNMMKSNKHKGELMIRCGKGCKNLDEESKKNYAKYGPPFRVTKLSAEVPVCQKRTAEPLESDGTPKRYKRSY